LFLVAAQTRLASKLEGHCKAFRDEQSTLLNTESVTEAALKTNTAVLNLTFSRVLDELVCMAAA
jgi:hypothetical protein